MTRDPTVLLKAIATGEVQAFTELYDAYSAALYALILRRVKDPETANKVLEDTFCKIWQEAGTYRQENGSPFIWMWCMARSLTAAVLQKQRKNDPSQHSQSLNSANGDLQGSGTDVAVNGQPDHPLHILELAYQQGLTEEEICRQTDLSVENVRARTRKGLQEFRNSLRDQE